MEIVGVGTSALSTGITELVFNTEPSRAAIEEHLNAKKYMLEPVFQAVMREMG